MNIFDVVAFGPEDVKNVMTGNAPKRTTLAVLTSQTCGEPCWHAREEVCRCSCGGKNHGCLAHGGTRPERTSKIDGHVYRLKAVGHYADIYNDAHEINRLAGYSSIAPAELIIGCQGGHYTEADIALARKNGVAIWWQQYRYTWKETDAGAPARIKRPAKSQLCWPELSGWKDDNAVYLLWERIQMPEKPAVLVVDSETGQPLANQLPPEN